MQTNVAETTLRAGLGCCWQLIGCLGRRSRENNLGKEGKILRVLSANTSVRVRSVRSWENGQGFQQSANWATVWQLAPALLASQSVVLYRFLGSVRETPDNCQLLLMEKPTRPQHLFSHLGPKVKCYFVYLTALCLIFHKPSGVLPICMCWQQLEQTLLKLLCSKLPSRKLKDE